MRLVVVYGLKTGDYGFLTDFYPSRRLAEECANRSIPLRFLFPRDVPSFLAEPRPAAELQETICLIRGKVEPEIAILLENAGYRTVNQAKALSLANDKLESARFLEKKGWPTPKTRSLSDFTPDDTSFRMRFPLVAKPRFGSRGEGVRLIRDAGGLEGLPEDTVLQEYIEDSHGRDLRFFFAGNAVLAVVSRQAAGGALVSNASTGGKMRLARHGEAEIAPWRRMTLDIAKEAGLWYGTVDYLYRGSTDGLELTVCELNGSPGFEALETDCGIDIAGPLVDRLAARFAVG